MASTMTKSIDVTLRDGTPITLRPVQASDAGLLEAGFAALSRESIYARFLGMTSLGPADIEALTAGVDGVTHLAWGATTTTDKGVEEGVAVARCIRTDPDAEEAEVAITVLDAWQGRGVGHALIEVLAEEARRVGITYWTGQIFASNQGIRRLLGHVATEVCAQVDTGGVLAVRYALGPVPHDAPTTHPVATRPHTSA